MCSAHATANAAHPLHASAVGSGPSAAARPTAVRTIVTTRTGTAARDGATRLYILSDDNNNAPQRTLLLAFDVRD